MIATARSTVLGLTRSETHAPLSERLYRGCAVAGECLVWTGATDAFGYGRIGRGRRGTGVDSTHRVAWMLANGEIPAGMCVLHSCDNPPCVRLNHLFLGTRADNNQDMTAKGRHATAAQMPRGEAHHAAKLTEDAVRLIRRSRLSSAALARQFGVSLPTVGGVRHNRTWTHVA